MSGKVDGKKIIKTRRNFLKDRKMKQTRGMIMKQKLKLASNWMEHRMTAVSRGFYLNRKVNAHKVMIKLMKRMVSLCVNSLLHGIGIVLQHLLGGNKNANNSYCQLPILTLNVRCKKGALGAPLKVDVIEGDGNCLFRAISYEVTLSQDHHGFFRMSACGILQTDLYQSEFESRHLNNMNVSDYIITTQIEMS